MHVDGERMIWLAKGLPIRRYLGLLHLQSSRPPEFGFNP